MDTLPYQQVFACVRDKCREHPDVQLTAEQLHRLTGVDDAVCRRVLEDFARAQFLTVASDGRYVRSEHVSAAHLCASVGDAARPRHSGVANGHTAVATRRDE